MTQPTVYDRSPQTAYWKAKRDGFTKELQEDACRDPAYASDFAASINGADIDYCMKEACKRSLEAYWFASHIPGADVEYCKQHMGKYLEQFLTEQMKQALK